MKPFFLLFLFATSCASSPKTTPVIPRLVVMSPDVSPFFMRQTIKIFAEDKVRELDAVVQYDGTELMTVFLDPSGRAGVSLIQRSTESKISGPWVDRIPFDLRWVMQVIGTTFMLSPIVADIDGYFQRKTRVGLVEDIWKNGRIASRRIVKDDTFIEYKWDVHPCPSVIVVENAKRAYKLTITTTDCEIE